MKPPILITIESGKANGFTEAEYKILQDIVSIQNQYISLDPTHPSDIYDWVNAIHILQGLIAQRATRRDYPNIFQTIVPKSEYVNED